MIEKGHHHLDSYWERKKARMRILCMQINIAKLCDTYLSKSFSCLAYDLLRPKAERCVATEVCP